MERWKIWWETVPIKGNWMDYGRVSTSATECLSSEDMVMIIFMSMQIYHLVI